MSDNISEILINNINNKRRDKNLKISQLAQISGVSDKTLRKILDGSTHNPTISNVALCAKALGCTTSDLIGETRIMTYQEDRLLQEFGKLDSVARDAVFKFMNTCLEIQKSKEKHAGIIKQVPLFLQKVSAGIGNYIDSDSFDYVNVDAEQVPESNVIALEVSGDSMTPLLFDGDYILVEPTKKIKNGDIGVFIVDGECVVKQFRPGYLISLNDEYKPMVLKDYDHVETIGKYIKKFVPQ